jgi:hypothetical protein
MTNKQALAALIMAFSIFSCRPQPDGPKRTLENGIEVVTNGLEPYPAGGQPNRLRLEQRFVVDFESPELAAVGIPRIISFDVDSQGNIYTWSHRSSGDFIFKFDSRGRFERSFGRSGQGPGEIDVLSYVTLTERDEVVVSDHGRDSMIVMSSTGTLLREMRLPAEADLGTLLSNGNVLAWRTQLKPKTGVDELQVVIFDQQLNELAVLGPTENLPDWARVGRINPLETNPTLGQGSISKGRIYMGNKQSGYEISVYDLAGTPIRKIRKAYRPVAVPEDVRKKVLDVFDMPIHKAQKGKLYFPDSMPPIQYFFPDDRGWLFVMTFEKGETPGSYLYDIFNPDGVFVGRTALDNSGNEATEIWGGPFEVRAKNNLLYYLRAKESGFQELVVCPMTWPAK